jgi:tetratricopeptide (TPR) repeat protein
VAEAAQLVGVILHFGLNFGDAAAGCYSLAAGAAREARDYDLWAAALIRHAGVPLYDDRPTQALSLLEAAAPLARRGDSTLPSRYWVAACSADAYAGVGDFTAWRTALEQAQDIAQVPDGERPAWLRFGYGQLLEEQGGSAVTAKQPEVALPALEAALSCWPAPTYRRGLILIDLAGAAVQARDIERACAYGREVVAIAQQNAGLVSKELNCMEQHFSPCTSTPLVKDLLRSISEYRKS